MISNQDLLSEIELWEVEINKQDFNKRLLEFAFFKIFVKFELFLINAFVAYSIGESSSKGYKPQRRLVFENESHLRNIISEGYKSYLDLGKDRLEKLAENIFDGSNPFQATFRDATFSSTYPNMKYIRDFIAHESFESRSKYFEKVLKPNNFSTFIEPHLFLDKKTKLQNKPMTYFSKFIQIIQSHTEVILDPTSYL